MELHNIIQPKEIINLRKVPSSYKHGNILIVITGSVCALYQ